MYKINVNKRKVVYQDYNIYIYFIKLQRHITMMVYTGWTDLIWFAATQLPSGRRVKERKRRMVGVGVEETNLERAKLVYRSGDKKSSEVPYTKSRKSITEIPTDLLVHLTTSLPGSCADCPSRYTLDPCWGRIFSHSST